MLDSMSTMIANLSIPSSKKIMIFGKNGFLGSYFFKFYQKNPNVYFCFKNSENKLVVQNVNLSRDMGIWDHNTLSLLIHKMEPNLVINAIALANIEECERNLLLAFEANATIPKVLAAACNEVEARIIHISTDAVFGQEGSLFTEIAVPVPTSNYGKTKLQGEKFVMEYSEKHLIIRTNFFGHHNLKSTLFNYFYGNLLAKHKVVGYSDVVFNPIYIRDLVLGIERFVLLESQGILHFVGNEVLSKFDFASKILHQIGHDSSLLKPQTFGSLNVDLFRKTDLTLSSNFRENLFSCVFDVNSGIEDAILSAKGDTDEF